MTKGNPEPSYVCGTGDKPLIYKTIGQVFDETCEQYPDQPAIIVGHQNIELDYAELSRRVNIVSANLLKLGLQTGDRIGIWSPNNFEWVVTQLATAKIGLVLVTVNPAYRVSELEYALNKASCKALILATKFKTSNYLEILENLAPELDSCTSGELVCEKLPHLKVVIQLSDETVPGMYKFSGLYDAVEEQHRNAVEAIGVQLQPDDPINIQFTSGTTGFPKGATLTHCNILNNGMFVTEAMRLTEQDRLCIPVPLYHCFGMVMGVLGCITHGTAMVFPDEAFEPNSVLRMVERHRCTALYGVPTMFIAILGCENFANFNLGSLRTGIMAGAPCPIDVMKRVINEMNMEQVTIAYGMTETSPVSFQSSTDDPVEKRVSTVGRVMPHVQVKIIDENGLVVPRGQRGELCTRGYSVMREYWDEPEKTRESIDATGWMHTGDLAVLDDEGYCDIVGRVKDMIIRGGENVYPRELEEYLIQHEKIQDVSVFGIPDEKYGEQICAWVQLRAGESATEEEIKDYCRGKIAHYKVPYRIDFVSEFPMTVTGKIQKFVMRDTVIERLKDST